MTNQEEITLSEANELLQVKPATESDVDEDGTEVDGDEAGQSEEYSFNEDAAFFYKVAARVTYITESSIGYMLLKISSATITTHTS